MMNACAISTGLPLAFYLLRFINGLPQNLCMACCIPSHSLISVRLNCNKFRNLRCQAPASISSLRSGIPLLFSLHEKYLTSFLNLFTAAKPKTRERDGK